MFIKTYYNNRKTNISNKERSNFMDFLDLFRYFLILIGPGILGALAFSLAARFRTEIGMSVVFVLDMLTFIVMITGLYFLHGVTTMAIMLDEFTCLSFTRNYALLSILVSVALGAGFGLLRRLFFWIRR
jgi:hypothetical protein